LITDFPISTDEAAALLRVKPGTLATWRCHGRGPKFVKIGRACFYYRADLLAWIEQQKIVPRAAA
jgi:hypothetical protein